MKKRHLPHSKTTDGNRMHLSICFLERRRLASTAAAAEAAERLLKSKFASKMHNDF